MCKNDNNENIRKVNIDGLEIQLRMMSIHKICCQLGKDDMNSEPIFEIWQTLCGFVDITSIAKDVDLGRAGRFCFVRGTFREDGDSEWIVSSSNSDSMFFVGVRPDLLDFVRRELPKVLSFLVISPRSLAENEDLSSFTDIGILKLSVACLNYIE